VSEPLLDVRDLCTEFRTEEGVVRAVDGVSFRIDRGEIVGLVGESGCGKSVASLSVLGLLPKPQGRIAGGAVRFGGRELTGLSDRELRQIRGNRVAMVFQDPMTSLNPYLRIGEQIAEVGELHQGLSRREARRRAVELLERVGIPDPAARARSYPHELSGGMRQRVMIAMALLCDPELLIADEPTTALDVTVQAQILGLLCELRRERSMAMVLISHDLGVIAGTCDRVLVMYAGRIVESAPVAELFRDPTHPYTRALLRSVPRVGGAARRRLESIEGLPPRLDAGLPDACRFAPRCGDARDACWRREPPLVENAPGRARRCAVPAGELR
jgi:oligopeptide transport system ATP-binding protein